MFIFNMFHYRNISQFIHPVADGQFDCLWFLTLRNNAAVSIPGLASWPCAVYLYQIFQVFVYSTVLVQHDIS